MNKYMIMILLFILIPPLLMSYTNSMIDKIKFLRSTKYFRYIVVLIPAMLTSVLIGAVAETYDGRLAIIGTTEFILMYSVVYLKVKRYRLINNLELSVGILVSYMAGCKQWIFKDWSKAVISPEEFLNILSVLFVVICAVAVYNLYCKYDTIQRVLCDKNMQSRRRSLLIEQYNTDIHDMTTLATGLLIFTVLL